MAIPSIPKPLLPLTIIKSSSKMASDLSISPDTSIDASSTCVSAISRLGMLSGIAFLATAAFPSSGPNVHTHIRLFLFLPATGVWAQESSLSFESEAGDVGEFEDDESRFRCL